MRQNGIPLIQTSLNLLKLMFNDVAKIFLQLQMIVIKKIF